MKKQSLKDFNPQRIARLETKMWRAYYGHNFFNLFVLLLKMLHEFFGLSYFSSLRAAYYMAAAATEFRLSRGRENSNGIVRKLTKSGELIARHSVENFDYQKVAELELKWWMIDRYPGQYKISREEALLEAVAELFQTDSQSLEEYANHRAQAMVLHDKAEENNKKTNWVEVESLLVRAFTALHKSLQDS